jgi:CCR4-NOT transcription complex subunit 2
MMGTAATSRPDGAVQQSEPPMPRSQTADSGIGSSQGVAEESGNDFVDPLAFLTDKDKFGIKGFTYMMQNFPDYAASILGQDISNMGLDLNASE